MLLKIIHTSNCCTRFRLQHVKTQTLLTHNPCSKLAISSLVEMGTVTNLQSHSGINRRQFVVYSSVEPGGVPSSAPPPNIISWVVAVAVAAAVIPFITYKWGSTFTNKVDTAMKITKDVAEAVEKVAETVEEVAEDISDDLPQGGKLRRAIDFVENLADRTAKDAGAIGDFIDEVQEVQEKADSFIGYLLKDELKNNPPPPQRK